MTKFSSRNLLEILRGYDLASDLDVPRQIEHIDATHPSDINTCFAFMFNKVQFYVLQDETAEDDVDYVLSQLHIISPQLHGEMVKNPRDNVTTYALPFKGKEVYLYQTSRLGMRLDVYLADTYPDTSRSTWQKVIKAGSVTVDGSVMLSPKYDIKPDMVVVAEPPKRHSGGGELPIIYKDSSVVVVNKPTGVLTHSKGALNDEFTVAEFVRSMTDVASDSDRPGIIHRLDRDTSGVIVTARTEAAASMLQKQFADRKVKKTYLAVVAHAPKLDEGLIDIPIARNPKSPSTFRAAPNGKSAETYYKVLAQHADGTALVCLKPRTGRTHQLRVHMAHIGAPIVGDRVYGTKGERLMLHAWHIEVTLPDGERHTFTAPVPTEFSRLFPDTEL